MPARIFLLNFQDNVTDNNAGCASKKLHGCAMSSQRLMLPLSKRCPRGFFSPEYRGKFMRIECKACHKFYTLPDDRLPHGKVVSFPCPACKGKITLDLRIQEEKPDASGDRLIFKPLTEEAESDLSSDDLKKRIIKRINDLPPMPKVLFKAREVLSDSNSSFKDISKIIETDQAIAAKILKVANSAYYGLSGMVSSIHQASVVLGYQTLEQVITMVSSSSLLGKQLRGYGLQAGILWKHSLGTAIASRLIAKLRAPSLENDAFSAGLIHDAGKLALDPHVLSKRREIDSFLRDKSPSFLEAERHVLGFDHTEIAHDLSQKWKLPENHAAAMRYHHTPGEANGNLLAHIVHLADHIAKQSGYGSGPGFDNQPVHAESLEKFKLKSENLEEISGQVKASVEEITASLN
ncbi:MAG: HDOD domain-containing protein [Desulfobacteraceae bacterium]|nr:MAG: HDOD domain-containing protein [Desulfobacteraceae bacterium]